MSSSDESFSEDDEDYVPEEPIRSDDDVDEVDDCHNESEKNLTDVDNNQQNDGNNQIDELWKTFKNDVTQKEKTNDKEETNGSLAKAEECETQDIKTKLTKPQEIKPNQKESDTVTITKVYDFAGEEVKVTKKLKRDSVEAIQHFREQSSTPPTGGILGRPGPLKKKAVGGIGGVLGRLGKKPKLSTLEKSKLDWKQYKEDEGIQEELQAYNKGKEGYLEKVSFLERTEMRQFERERDMRLKQSSKR